MSASNGWVSADEGCVLTSLVDAPAYKRSSMSPEWEAAASYAAASVQSTLAQLFGLGVSAPTVGYELLGHDGRVVAECELAWPDEKLCVLLAGQPADAFVVAGWTALYHDADGLSETIAKRLT
jgi:DEAD/DEAH box helicase domain-containing protein